MTAPESSIEAALYANDNDVSDACMWLLGHANETTFGAAIGRHP